MRLISAEIAGIGRIVNSKVNLDSSVIAVVGPNEAGKTTFLNALTFLESRTALISARRSRFEDQASEAKPVICCTYVLDDADIEAISSLDLNEPAEKIKIFKYADDLISAIEIFPEPVKNVSNLRAASRSLRVALQDDTLLQIVDPKTPYLDPEAVERRDYKKELSEVRSSVEAAIAKPGKAIPARTIQLATSLLTATVQEAPRSVEIVRALEKIKDWVEMQEPYLAAERILRERCPEFVLFTEEDRAITSSYDLNEKLLTAIPKALQNLSKSAELDLPKLLQDVQSRDQSRWRTSLRQANLKLDKIFQDAWKQSSLSVNFELHSGKLNIELVEDGKTVTVFSERSAGLKMFVALVAFLRARDSSRPAILLIDEAENHLHIDAQADLVNMFVQQTQAQKIVYTTHSPACLPPDLGTGIRVVAPVANQDQVSKIRNNFWTEGAGYSPLMMAMGAAAAAFTPARFVVLAEGASDMILLPSLLRLALNREVQYQVAPGLSEVSQRMLSNLDLEASRVVYLVDGDKGGENLKKNLLKAEVNSHHIVSLESPGVEELVDVENYLATYEELLRESNMDFQSFDEEDRASFQSGERPVSERVGSWVDSNGLRKPSKVSVASRLVEIGLHKPSEVQMSELRRVNLKIESALGLPASNN